MLQALYEIWIEQLLNLTRHSIANKLHVMNVIRVYWGIFWTVLNKSLIIRIYYGAAGYLVTTYIVVNNNPIYLTYTRVYLLTIIGLFYTSFKCIKCVKQIEDSQKVSTPSIVLNYTTLFLVGPINTIFAPILGWFMV